MLALQNRLFRPWPRALIEFSKKISFDENELNEFAGDRGNAVSAVVGVTKENRCVHVASGKA
jgi:hypothetical protein